MLGAPDHSARVIQKRLRRNSREAQERLKRAGTAAKLCMRMSSHKDVKKLRPEDVIAAEIAATPKRRVRLSTFP